MKTITIRDLRLRWPEMEKTLQVEHELTITRDGQPVAKLASLEAPKPSRRRWDPEAHQRWLKRFWGGKKTRWVEKYLMAERTNWR
jgi:antitoxin (DNA-binding transcriptional repressor) of toxin-antitoxin stability system